MGDKSNFLKMQLKPIELQIPEDSESGSAWIDIIVTIEDADHFLFNEITKDDLTDMSRNFSRDIPSKDLPIDFFHISHNEAAGWLTELRTVNDGNKIQGFVEFTPKATKMILDKEVKFFSPSFEFVHLDSQGNKTKNVLVGGGLTNQPFLTMDPIELAKRNKGEEMTKPNDDKKPNDGATDDLESVRVELTKEKTEKVELSKKVTDLEKEVADLKEEKVNLSKDKTDLSKGNQELIDSVKDIKVELSNQKFDDTFKTLLSEGKVVPAQKEFMKAQLSHEQLAKFGETAPVIISLGKVNGSDSSDTVELSTAATNVQKQMNLTAEAIKDAQELVDSLKG